MVSMRQVAISMSFLLLAFVPARAQMGMRSGPPQFRGVWNPVVGHGAAYELQTKDGRKSSMEIAIVGKEIVDGKDGYWLEITMNNPQIGGEFVSKNLTVSDGKDTVVSRVIMQMPGRPPMEMSSQMLQMHHENQPADIRKDAEDVGAESVTTPAGTFACEHYRLKDGSGDSWVSEKSSPYGLVKFQGKDSTMVLTKMIADAKDKITGTPQPFNPMMMQPPPQQPEQ